MASTASDDRERQAERRGPFGHGAATDPAHAPRRDGAADLLLERQEDAGGEDEHEDPQRVQRRVVGLRQGAEPEDLEPVRRDARDHEPRADGEGALGQRLLGRLEESLSALGHGSGRSRRRPRGGATKAYEPTPARRDSGRGDPGAAPYPPVRAHRARQRNRPLLRGTRPGAAAAVLQRVGGHVGDDRADARPVHRALRHRRPRPAGPGPLGGPARPVPDGGLRGRRRGAARPARLGHLPASWG